MIRKNEIVLYLARHMYDNTLFMQVLNIVFPYHSTLVPFLFTPLLPSNPISHQLSHRECFLISCHTHISEPHIPKLGEDSEVMLPSFFFV